jgi:hypothetical protein
VSPDRVQAVARTTAEKLDNGVQLHELTGREWAAVRAQYQLSFIQELTRGRLAGRR